MHFRKRWFRSIVFTYDKRAKSNKLKGGEASSWDYGQKLKKHLKHFFTEFQLSTIYRF